MTCEDLLLEADSEKLIVREKTFPDTMEEYIETGLPLIMIFRLQQKSLHPCRRARTLLHYYLRYP